MSVYFKKGKFYDKALIGIAIILFKRLKHFNLLKKKRLTNYTPTREPAPARA